MLQFNNGRGIYKRNETSLLISETGTGLRVSFVPGENPGGHLAGVGTGNNHNSTVTPSSGNKLPSVATMGHQNDEYSETNSNHYN